jgi:two-component system cell cycle sensor histidine kinase/response regulator CckA
VAKPAPAETRSDAEQRRRVLNVAKAVSATLGREFFQSLVEHLAKTLGANYAYAAEVTTGPAPRLRSLVAYAEGLPAEGFEQDLTGSGANHVLIDGSVAWSKGATRVFPLDPVLERMKAEGFVGVRLSDSAGQVIGLLAVVTSKPLRDVPLAKSVLETFAPRAAAELERKRADDALRESEQRYRAFISSSTDAMWRIEFDRPISLRSSEDEQIESIYRFGYLAECNDAMARLAGARSPEDLVGTQFSALFPPSDERARRELVAVVRTRYRFATFHTTLNDDEGRKVYRIRTQCGHVQNGELRRIWGTTRDITGLKRAELAAEAAERRFRDVLEHIHTPVVMLDQRGLVTFCNDALARIAHSSRDELAGRNWLELIVDSDERAAWSALLNDSAGEISPRSHFEGPLHLRGGDARLVVWDTIAVEDEEGIPVGLAALGRDVTAERSLEAQVAHARRLDSVGRLAAGISHDFNNLLQLIVGNVGLLLERVDPNVEIYQTILAVNFAAEECAVLTQQLLEIGRGQRHRPEVLSLNQVIASQQPILRSITDGNVELVLDLSPTAGFVYADPGQVQRILANLVTNARDAMPDGGTVTITTFNLDQSLDSAHPHHPDLLPGSYVGLRVVDTGTGISADVRDRMFDPFFTTKAPGHGTGLGLAIVYGFVTQSGGYISARGEPGKGTTIEILLSRTELLLEDLPEVSVH